MSTESSNLYPPILLDTYPAVLKNQECRIYFSLSIYNSIYEINQVLVSITNQKTNASVLNKIYAAGQMIKPIQIDDTISNDFKYFIRINPEEDFRNEEFEIREIYKIQLRFISSKITTIDFADITDSKTGVYVPTAFWLNNNRKFFSEWSRVGLIKGISVPTLHINDFSDQQTNQENSEIIITNAEKVTDLMGYLSFEEENENEYLKTYRIKLYEKNNLETPVFDSQQINQNIYGQNHFTYTIPYGYENGVKYRLTIEYTTNNLYKSNNSYDFSIIDYNSEQIPVTIETIPDQQNGRIDVHIQSKTSQDTFFGNLTIRRTSSKSNFHIWEDIKNIQITAEELLDFVWSDLTIESGVWYKYGVQKRTLRGGRGILIRTEEPVMCTLQHIFLTADNCQLKIQFNPSISDFRYNVSQFQQNTIGSQFPFVVRNGNNYYRSFSIGGLISSFMDTTDWYDPHFYDGSFHDDENEIKAFTSKAELYKDSKTLYENYNKEHKIDDYSDFIYERVFREKVYEFLYKHNVKLFRSETEGNILIKLMNIAFQPEQVLGRRLYSFTATAVQVDTASIAACDKYNIQSIGSSYNPNLSYYHEVMGQEVRTFSVDSDNIIKTIIEPKFKNSTKENYIHNAEYLTWVRIEITSEPFLIQSQNNVLTFTTDPEDKNVIAGYIVEVNGQDMIIKPSMSRRIDGSIQYIGFLELRTNITSLKFKTPGSKYKISTMIDYCVVLKQQEDISKIPIKVSYEQGIGQLYGTFNMNESLIKKISNKYYNNNSKYLRHLAYIGNIDIQGPVNAVIFVKDSKDDAFNKHILENGVLALSDDDVVINGLYVGGLQLYESADLTHSKKREFIPPDENVYESLIDIANPITNKVYNIKQYAVEDPVAYYSGQDLLVVKPEDTEIIDQVDKNYLLFISQLTENKQYIYYNNMWYPFLEGNVVACPIDLIVNYSYQIEQNNWEVS